MNEQTYRQAKATIIKAVMVDKLSYKEVSELIKDKYGIEYEEVAYKIDEEGVF